MAYVFAHGSGTAADPYLVETAADLNGVRDYLSAHFKQVADIDLSGYANWEPIGTSQVFFTGSYNGQYFEITNLNSTKGGLFKYLTNATVQNVLLKNININSSDNIGGIAAYASGDYTKIFKCGVEGILIGRNTSGICNIGNQGIVEECYFKGLIEGTGNVSGIKPSYYGTAKNCYVIGEVIYKGVAGHSQRDLVAGIAPWQYGGHVFNCYFHGEVQGRAYAGGINSGQLFSGSVNGAVNLATSIKTYGEYDGGKTYIKGIGKGKYVSTSRNFYNQDMTGTTTTGDGTPITLETAKTEEFWRNQAEWDMDNVWAISPYFNDGFPSLRWQNLQPPPVEVLPSCTPQSTIKLEFSAGDSASYPMGIFYADKSVYKVGSAGTKIDGRNSIGKYLKDQSFDERCNYPSQAVSTMLESMLSGAGLTKYYVQPNLTQMGMDFAPNKNILDGIEEILQYLPSWQMREEVDGTVVIGERTDSHFTQPSRYTFQRDRDIFSREVVTDDRAIYGRVCVHTEDFTVRVYRPVTSDLGWTPPAQKTLYQQVPEGTTSMEAATIANSLAASMANSGKIETFVCAFRPQIIPGDEAEILEADASKTMLGVITQVGHSFGVQGFYTEIVVDSGGRVGKPRFKDIVSAFTPPPASKKN